jgi:hypothetical protein
MNNETLMQIYEKFIGSRCLESEEIINTLYALSKNEIEKNNDEPIVSANRLRISVLMPGQDGEYYICKKRNNGSHYWFKKLNKK